MAEFNKSDKRTGAIASLYDITLHTPAISIEFFTISLFSNTIFLTSWLRTMHLEGACNKGMNRASLIRLARRVGNSHAQCNFLASFHSPTSISSGIAFGLRGPSGSSGPVCPSRFPGGSAAHRGNWHLAAAAVETPAEKSSAVGADLTLANLPTSDQSDELLRVRHSVSFSEGLLLLAVCFRPTRALYGS